MVTQVRDPAGDADRRLPSCPVGSGPAECSPVGSRWRMIASGVLLLLWILFLAWIAIAG